MAEVIGNVIAIANLIVRGNDTKVDTVEIPAGESTTEIIVNGGTVAIVNAKGETTVTGTGTGKVKTVKVEAAVTVASGTVDKVEVPASAPENVGMTVSGSGSIEVEANGTLIC